jgi:serine/threonine protein phosphatase PrpC
MVIQCSNPACRADMAPPVGRCSVCQTPLLYRFLLAVGDLDLELPPYTLVANRYQVWQHPIWIDTQPEAPLQPLEQIPPLVLPYLRLGDLTQHMPRPYTYLSPGESSLKAAVLLLDAAPLGLSINPADQIEVALLPCLTQAWANGTALQQLNWLRQIAQIWPALAQEKMTATLLTPPLLRVDQALLRLTYLVADADFSGSVTLATLGQQWRSLVATAQPSVQTYLGWLTEALEEGEIATSQALVAELEQAIQTLAQGLSVTVDWGADTDQGPARDRNEDACYPSGSTQRIGLSTPTAIEGEPALPLLLVCDGIGGHEQGNVASNTAIKLLLEDLQPLAQQPDLSPTAVTQRLKQAIIRTNNAIVSRNNNESRSARARMGTTVVVALVHGPYVFIAHVGDSRAYRVSAHTGYQVTLDDDVAAREAHMGYALYQEAVQMPSGGALVQALGINDSGYLHPTVQYLLIDDPCVLLLCSDGLSDYDRIDALWPYTVRSLVGNTQALGSMGQLLIQQANRLNGHDNVTVGLMRFLPQITHLPTLPGQRLQTQAQAAPAAPSPHQTPQSAWPEARPSVTTSLAPTPPRSRPWWAFWGGAAGVLLLLAGAGWLYSWRQPRPLALGPTATPWPTVSLAGQPLFPLALALTADIPVGSFWQVSPPLTPPSTLAVGAAMLRLATSPGDASPPGEAAPVIPAGSILRVVNRQTLADQTQWVRLQICSIPAGNSLEQMPTESDQAVVDPLTTTVLAQQLSQPGDQGWVSASAFYRGAIGLDTVTPTQMGGCLTSP